MFFEFVCTVVFCVVLFFFFKQKTAYEMRISDWSSDVCSSDLQSRRDERDALHPAVQSRDGNVSASICGAPPDRAGEISAWLHAGAHRADCPWLRIFAPGAFVRHVQASCRGDTGALSATQARGGHEMRS